MTDLGILDLVPQALCETVIFITWLMTIDLYLDSLGLPLLGEYPHFSLNDSLFVLFRALVPFPPQ